MLFPIMFPLLESMADAFPVQQNTRKAVSLNMPTDIRKVDGGHEFLVNLPGFKKENISVSISDGIMSINAEYEDATDDASENSKYVRNERTRCSCSRKYRVGENIKSDEVKASFKDGVLTVFVPETVKEAETTNIAIE